MSHNFTHSFVSLMNYVDDGYVIDDLKNIARKSEGEIIRIEWLPKNNTVLPIFTNRVKKSILNSIEWLPKHMEQHQVNEDMVSEMRTDICFKKNVFFINAYLKDIRGKEYENSVEC